MKVWFYSVAVTFALATAMLASAAQNWLITPEEVNREVQWRAANAEPIMLRPKSLAPGRPDIAMLAPASVTEPLKAPFPIRIVFKAKDGAVIKPETFEALYGFLKINITDRLTGKAKVTSDGVQVEHATIPPGSHRLLLTISDDRNRKGELEIRFTVQDNN